MNWPEALKLLEEGTSVYREDDPPNEYVDVRFSPIRGIPDPGYPHTTDNGTQYKLVRVVGDCGGVPGHEEPWEPDADALAAQDWDG